MLGNVHDSVKGNTVQTTTNLCPVLCTPLPLLRPGPSLGTGLQPHQGASALLPCRVAHLTCHIIHSLTRRHAFPNFKT